MKKHNYAFRALLFMVGAAAGFVISIYAFFEWMATGFAIESRSSSQSPGTYAFLLLGIGVAATVYCAGAASIATWHSQDHTERDDDT